MTACTLVVMALASSVLPGAGPRAVSRQDILLAMRESQGYDPTATTNGARFRSEVLRRLARITSALDPSQSPLYIDHRDWFVAYLERTGLSAEKAPLFVRLAHDHGQDMVADYRRERVVETVEPGPAPELALNVCIWWPQGQNRRGARARKAFFEVVSTVTVHPDGRTEKDLPRARPDLLALEARLKQPLELVHPPLECGGAQ